MFPSKGDKNKYLISSTAMEIYQFDIPMIGCKDNFYLGQSWTEIG